MRSSVLSFLVGISALYFVAQAGSPFLGAVDECDAERLGRSGFGALSTIYTVTDGNLSGICHGVDDPAVYEAWAHLTVFTDAAQRQPIVALGAFRSSNPTEVVAYASALDRDRTRFVIVVNLDYVDREPWLVRRTVAHEFAHVLTRSAPGIGGDDCGEFGCVTSSNYMGLWVDRFWSDAELSSVQGRGYADTAGAARRCAGNAGFPTNYAATNPYEDFSESFEFFLFSNRVAGPVQPRIQFLSSFPELVQMRARITAAGLADTRQFIQNCG